MALISSTSSIVKINRAQLFRDGFARLQKTFVNKNREMRDQLDMDSSLKMSFATDGSTECKTVVLNADTTNVC